MTATGAVTDGLGLVADVSLIKPKSAGDSRLVEIRNRVLNVVRGSDLVLIEGYLNRSMSAGITGMVHGSVRSMLIENEIKYATLPPASLKKYATGRGNATKTDMAIAALKRGGLEFRDDNECDAWWLWVAANDHLGSPVVALPKIQRESLDKIKMEV